MGNKYADLIQQTAQLRQAAARVSSELSKANADLAQSGIPLTEVTLKKLVAYRLDYQQLRAQAMELGQPQLSEALQEAGESVSLVALENALRAAHDEDQVSRRVRETALTRLRAFVAVVHKDGLELPSLLVFQEKALLLLEGAEADPRLVTPEMEELLDDEHPLNALSILAQGSENLADDQWERLQAVVAQSFDRNITIAACRGKLIRRTAPPPKAAQPQPAQASGPAALDAIVSATVAISTPRPINNIASSSEPVTSVRPPTGQIRIAGSRRPLTVNLAKPAAEHATQEENVALVAKAQAAQAPADTQSNATPVSDTVECLFCEQSIRTYQERCPHCKAVLILDDVAELLSNTEVNERTVRDAIERRKLSGDKRTENHVAIAIGYLNLKASHDALGYLSIAYRANPNSEALRKQVSELRQRKLVLVIDGSATVRRNIALHLERHMHRTITASDGASGMNAMRQYTPDIVLLDVNMPIITGFDVCKMIRSEAHTKHVPVVMLSSNEGFFDKLRGRMAGATDHLAKPFDPAALLRIVTKHLTPADERDRDGLRTRTRHLTISAN